MKVGFLLGALAGMVVVLLTATGWRVFMILSFPAIAPIALREGQAITPSLKVAALNSLLYSCVGTLIGLCWPVRRPPPGHCQACGYDLIGNVSGTCPECGSSLPGR